MMLKMPRAVDKKARDVGTQERKAEEKLMRYWLVGVQCSGRFANVPRSDDRDITAFRIFREGATDECCPYICYSIREDELVNRFLLESVMWSDRTDAAERTAVYDFFRETVAGETVILSGSVITQLIKTYSVLIGYYVKRLPAAMRDLCRK